MTTAVDAIPSAYAVLRADPLPRLEGCLYDLVHEDTGARHIHLAVPDRNNYFCALYRTPPDDSTGAPHIMEHCVSGGSRRFPPGAGGDMYTRSLLTDVNGMTHADFTTFYVATRNALDLANWIEYIVDVTLHPRLEEDTFLRHRGHFELDDPSDPSSLRFVGTVFNEMKAVFASPERHGTLALRRALFPGHPYANHAGGDPPDMPGLTYEGIVAFFRRFYHPANAVYVSRGDAPITAILAKVQDVMKDGVRTAPPVETPDIPTPAGSVTSEAPLPTADRLGQVVLGWATRASATDSYARLVMEVVTQALFGHTAAPVRTALRSSKLVDGHIEAKILPLKQSTVELTVAGADPSRASRIDDVVHEALAIAARSGLDDGVVDDVIASIELGRRERADALQQFVQTVSPTVVHGGDPFPALELDSDLERLARERRSLGDLVRSHFVDNTHRARVALVPDAGLEQKVMRAESKWLAEVAATLTDEDRKGLVEQAQRLAKPPERNFERRGLTPDEALTTLESVTGRTEDTGGVPVAVYDVSTDGIAYLGLRVDLNGIDEELIPYVGILASSMARAGADGGITVHTRSATDPTGERCYAWLEIGGRALARDSARLPQSLSTVLSGVAPTHSLVTESASALEQGVMMNAQVHLRRLAGRALRRSHAVDDLTNGLGHLSFLKAQSRSPEQEIARRMDALRSELFTRSRLGAFVAGDAGDLLGPLAEVLEALPQGEPPAAQVTDRLDDERPHRAVIVQLPVAFTCQAHAIPGLAHPDAAAVAVLGQVLWSGYLNAEIRKGGAYGVDIETLPHRGLHWVSSRRDPIPDATYRAFSEAIARFNEGRWDGPGAADGMIPVLRVTDPVDSPAEAARRAWLATFTGNDTEVWNEFRRRVLDVTEDDLARVAHRYMGRGARATLIGRTLLDTAGRFEEVTEL